jgi:hypothetical protein
MRESKESKLISYFLKKNLVIKGEAAIKDLVVGPDIDALEK